MRRPGGPPGATSSESASTRLELRPGVIPEALPGDAQLEQLLVRCELLRAHDRLLEGLRDQSLLEQRVGVDPVLRRRVPGEVDEVVVRVLLVEHEVDELVRE